MRWTALATHFKLLDLLDNVVDWARACRIALVVAPWHCAMGHAAGDGFLCSLKGGRPAMRWAMVGWWMDVAVGIVAAHQPKEALGISGRHIKKLLPSEDRLMVEGDAESMLRLHQATNAGVANLLVRHDPAVGVMVGLKKKEPKKNCQCQKRNVKRSIVKHIKCQTKDNNVNDAAASSRTPRPTDQNTKGKLTIVKMIDSETEMEVQKRQQFWHGFGTRSEQ